MSFGEITFWLFIAAIAFALIVKLAQPSEEQKEEERQMRLRLEDPYIYDPETGAKLTLEEAESGNWLAHDNADRIRSDQEIDQYYDGVEKTVEKISNYLKLNGYSFNKLSEADIEVLEDCVLLKKYDHWSYSHSFDGGSCRVIFPEVKYFGDKHHIRFQGTQLLFWIRIENVFGNYFLRNKDLHEKVFDLIRNDDAFELDGFEVFTVRESKNIIPMLRLLAPFANQANLEIEIKNENLFIKTVDEPTMERFLGLRKLTESIC